MFWLKKFANIASVVIGIGVCLYGAVTGIYLATTVAVLLLLLVHIALVQYSLSEACVIILAGIAGSFTEIINISFGFYDYAGFEEQAVLLPTWIVLLWFLVGSSARHALSVFFSKPVLMPIAGIIGAIMLFTAGALSGAIRFQPVDKLSMGLAIFFWAITIIFILYVGNKFFEQSRL